MRRTLRDCLHGVLLVIREQHQRHNIAHLKVKLCADLIQHVSERGPSGNQIEQTSFAHQQGLYGI